MSLRSFSRGSRRRGLASITGPVLRPADAGRFAQVIENHVVGTGLYYAVNGNHLRDAPAMRRASALLDADRHPHAVAAAAHLFPDLDAAFDHASDAILDAIEALAAAPTTNPTKKDR